MKKLLVILAVLLTCLLAFAACDNGTNENKGASENKGETNFNQQAGKPDASHTHAFGEWETTKNATCTTEGEKVRYCTCGEQQASTVAMLGHTEVTDKAVAATCTTSGLTEGKHCSTCYEVIIEQKTVEALGHTEVTDKAVAATCTTAGLTEGKHCSVCNTTIVAQAAIEKLSHNYVNEAIIKNATCIAKGSKKLTCENCSAYITQEYELEKLAATEINKQALNYVGEIIVYDKQGKELGLATGFVYSQDGKIITNYHVIEDAYSAKITINGKSYQITQVLAYDSNIDLAVLKVNSTFNNYAKICKNPIEVGSTVYAIGSSRGMTNTFSQGIVTYYDRVVDGVSHLQHDASITNGNSGGPLINEYGEVVGINTWGITNSQNLNFAVFTKELDNLEFDTPMTMAEFYEKEYSAFERIKDYVIEKGIYNSDGNYYRLVLNTTYSSDYTGSYSRAIYYYVESNSITFDYVINNGDYWVYFKVYDDVDGLYYWHYFDDSREMSGTLEASSYNSESLLTYSYTDFTSSLAKTEVQKFASSMMTVLCSWITNDLSGIGVSLGDLGFNSFDNTKEAIPCLDLLKYYVSVNGTYDSTYKCYRIAKIYSSSGSDEYYYLYYYPYSGHISASLFLYGNMRRYYTYLGLDVESYGALGSYGTGLFCAGDYSIYSSGEYVIQNEADWILNPSAFTPSSTITNVWYYDGMESSKSALLNIYKINICETLDWLSDYFYDNSIGITLKDIGFTAYE